ncbi:hypothetical protein CYMTET_40140 [Cymbomonas tetramitiformis]|uniref:Uncharacterized protein n=1 Tax=Cymbomonas tetramitiformis TaxID=36881 RepID=A0AAE0C8M4_9CHLO|nr:hypothetical protein CYMTET_40140 [Cymbomonas tetramitiformis]
MDRGTGNVYVSVGTKLLRVIPAFDGTQQQFEYSYGAVAVSTGDSKEQVHIPRPSGDEDYGYSAYSATQRLIYLQVARFASMIISTINFKET